MTTKETLRKILPIVAIFAMVVFFAFYYPTTAGVDNYYHIRHAWVYQTQGISKVDFPWLKDSVVGQWGGDIWYGFHLLLIPFTLFNDLFLGMKLATIAMTFVALLSFYFIFKKLSLRWPFFWTLLFSFSIPDVNFRLLMLRPHVITLILSLLIFYLFTQKKSGWIIFLASAAISFIHLALLWLPLFVALIITVNKIIFEKTWEVKRNIYLLLGLFLGWILRPNAFSALKIAYIQVVQLAIEKINKVPLKFGSELKPGNNSSVVLHEILPILFILTVAIFTIIFYLKMGKQALTDEKKTTLSSSLALSLIFGIMFYTLARRSADIWVMFSFIFVGLVFSLVLENKEIYSKFKRKILMVSIIVLTAMAANTLRFSLGYAKDMPPVDVFKNPALWLKENSQAGDIVFNIHWDNFPFLFFWNQHNYYINGMDPIFEYSFSKSLYLKHYFIDIDKILMVQGEAYTCGSNPCNQNAVTTVYSVLKNDFKAKYVFLELPRNPRVYKYLDSDSRYKEVFNNGREIIFQVL